MTRMRFACRHGAALLAGALLLAVSTTALALRVEDIASPRPKSWVADTAELLTPAQEAELDQLGNAIHAQDGAELAIVTVRSTAGADARTFATALFNHWQIGHRDRDNGVLLFVAIDDRAAELILGDGVDSDDQVGTVDDVMQRTIVPLFRAGTPDRAIIAGAHETARRILLIAPAALPAAPLAAPPAPPPPAHTGPADDSSGDTAKQVGGIAGGGGLLAALWALVRRRLRNRPRKCASCGAAMQRLDDAADDTHLSAPERTEERLGSVDYDVWICGACTSVSKLRYGAFFTRYKRCPQCRAVTKSSAETTLVAANYDRGGRVRVDEHCEHCGYRNSTERTTARLTRSSSSSSGFGGGSSSGRGSSGRW